MSFIVFCMQSEHVKLHMIDVLVENSLIWRESFSRRKANLFSEHRIRDSQSVDLQQETFDIL